MITNEVNKVLNDNINTLNDNQFICECGKRYKLIVDYLDIKQNIPLLKP